MSIASFFHHVKSVILGCSKKQMIWIYAGAIVAMVQNTQAVWNRSIFNHPGNYVSADGSSFVAASEPSISNGFSCEPDPTPIGYSEFISESSNNAFGQPLRLYVLGRKIGMCDVVHNVIVPGPGGYWPCRTTLNCNQMTTEFKG